MEVVDPSRTFVDCVGLLHSLLNNEFVRSFILETASASDLSILTSKTCIQHAVVGAAKLGMPLRTKVFEINWLCIPAFCFSKYSALIFVKEGNMPMKGTGYLNRDGTTFIRAIRDDETGTVLGVGFPEGGSIADCNFYITNRQLRTRQRLSFRVANGALRSRNLDEIRVSVHAFNHVTQHLACKHCTSGNICFCAWPRTAKPKHPLDLSTSGRNFSDMVGSYSGLFSSVSLRNNAQFQLPIFGGIEGGNQPGTFARLHSYAISQSLARYFSMPPPGNIPFSAELITNAQRTMAEYLPILSSSALENSTSKTPETTAIDNTFSDIHFKPSITEKKDSHPARTKQPSAEVGECRTKDRKEGDFPESSIEAKALRRRTKNRESAARSNLKKRLKIASLKKDIEDAKQFEQRLKVEFEILQLKNTVLRQQLEGNADLDST